MNSMRLSSMKAAREAVSWNHVQEIQASRSFFARCGIRGRFKEIVLSYTAPIRLKELLLPFLRCLAVVSLLFAQCVFARADSLSEFSDSFWRWRAQEQPFSGDDIPRIERP